MMQGFYLLAMQQARRRTLLAALACLAAMISLVDLAFPQILRSL